MTQLLIHENYHKIKIDSDKKYRHIRWSPKKPFPSLYSLLILNSRNIRRYHTRVELDLVPTGLC